MSPWVQGLRSASVVAEQTSPGRLAPHLPRDSGYRWAGAPWFKVSPPARSARGMRSPGPHSVSAPLRSAQSRHPPDVLRPIFRWAPVVVWQALPMGPRSPLRFGRRRTDIPRFKGSASILAGIFRLLLIEMQFFSGLVRNVFLMAGLEDGNKYPVPILPEVNPRWLDKTPVHF